MSLCFLRHTVVISADISLSTRKITFFEVRPEFLDEFLLI